MYLGGAIIAIVISSIAYAVRYHSMVQKLKRQLRASPVHTLTSMPDNAVVRIVGQAFAVGEQGPTLYAPLTGRPCLMYIVIVEERVGKSMEQIIREQGSVSFVLADSTSTALVDPTGAQTVLTFDCATHSGTFDPANAIEKALLARHGEQSTNKLFNRNLHYREAVVEVGETVAVLGSGVRNPELDSATNVEGHDTRPRVLFSSSAKFPLVISDWPNATRNKTITVPSARLLPSEPPSCGG